MIRVSSCIHVLPVKLNKTIYFFRCFDAEYRSYLQTVANCGDESRHGQFIAFDEKPYERMRVNSSELNGKMILK